MIKDGLHDDAKVLLKDKDIIKEVNKWETEMQNIFLPLYITMNITLITTYLLWILLSLQLTYPSIPSTIITIEYYSFQLMQSWLTTFVRPANCAVRESSFPCCSYGCKALCQSYDGSFTVSRDLLDWNVARSNLPEYTYILPSSLLVLLQIFLWFLQPKLLWFAWLGFRSDALSRYWDGIWYEGNNTRTSEENT